MAPSDSAADTSPSENPVQLSVDDILTITCQLCRSSLLVNESKLGTEVTCPDCHSSIIVARPKGRSNSRSKRNTGRPRPKTNQRVFDPDAELKLEEPVERPTVDRSPDLDEGTEDLLSAPLPQLDPLPEVSEWGEELVEPEDGDGQPASEQGLTRRQRYERMQRRMISEGREEMRRQARKELAARKSGVKVSEADDDSDEVNPRRKKRRRRRKGKGGNELQSPRWVNPAFGWLRQRSLIVGWVLVAGCLSVPYATDADWSPLVSLDRGYTMLTQSPLVLDVWLIVNSVLLIVGSVGLYFLCGRSFAANAETTGGPVAGSEGEPEAESRQVRVEASSIFTTLHFALPWLLAGLPFLYWSILVLPAQFLIVPPLLVGSWLNGSIWKFVRADGLIDSDKKRSGSKLWRKFYGIQIVAAAIAILPVLLIRNGGVPAVIGCFLIGGIMIGMAGICGHHCRDLSKSLEPSP